MFGLNFRGCLIGGPWFLIQIPGKRPPQRPEVKDPPSVPWNRVLQFVSWSSRKNASNRSRYVDDIWRPCASGLFFPTVTTSFQLWVSSEIGCKHYSDESASCLISVIPNFIWIFVNFNGQTDLEIPIGHFGKPFGFPTTHC